MAATHAKRTSNDRNTTSRFPEEALNYRSDVTREKVAVMRERARTAIEGDEWDQIDGFGTIAYS